MGAGALRPKSADASKSYLGAKRAKLGAMSIKLASQNEDETTTHTNFRKSSTPPIIRKEFPETWIWDVFSDRCVYGLTMNQNYCYNEIEMS